MKLQYLKKIGTWRDVADEARTTIGMKEGKADVMPSTSWKYKILMAEHSPIRLLHYHWKWIDIPYCYSVHFARHKVGIEHWVKTSRSDRTGIDRATLSQEHPVNHSCEANAQAIINISRKRLCRQASPTTQEAWQLVVNELKIVEPCLADICVPSCVAKGFCPEFKSCGYINSEAGKEARQAYKALIDH